jgi:hypothetical protein
MCNFKMEIIINEQHFIIYTSKYLFVIIDMTVYNIILYNTTARLSLCIPVSCMYKYIYILALCNSSILSYQAFTNNVPRKS